MTNWLDYLKQNAHCFSLLNFSPKKSTPWTEPEHESVLIMALTKGRKVPHSSAPASLKGHPSAVDLTVTVVT